MEDDKSDFERLKERLTPKPLPWENFESEVADYLQEQLEFLNLGLNPATARVIQKPEYFSKQRESKIKFDVSIEVWPIADANRPSLLWLWECKDYPGRNVDVDEVEEFHDKMHQVAAHKGTIATRKGFATGAIKIANSYGIGLVTLNKQLCAHLAFSRDSGIIDRLELKATYCLYTDGEVGKETDLESVLQDELTKSGWINW